MSPIIAKLSESMKRASIIEASGNLKLPAMRMMYAALHVPVFPSKRERDPKKKRWGITGLIPHVADISIMEKTLNEIVAEQLTEAKRKPLADGSLPYNWPILKTAKIQSLAAYAEEYPFCVRLGSREYSNDGQMRPAPEVISAKNVSVTEDMAPKEIYNGRWFTASCNPFWYPPHDGKPGISLGLGNVQLLYNDDPLAGGKAKATAEFAAVDLDEDEEVEEAAYE